MTKDSHDDYIAASSGFHDAFQEQRLDLMVENYFKYWINKGLDKHLQDYKEGKLDK